jgi:hypothetical protein
MIKEIPPSDVTVRPFKVYKEWTFSHQDQDEVPLYFGENRATTFYEDDLGPEHNGVPKQVLYRSIRAQFYLNSSTSSIVTEVGRRRSYASTNERVLGEELAVLLIPQRYYGEGIKPGSFTLTTGSLTYTDDGFSNLVITQSGTESILGNIFYDRGMVVLTKDVVSGSSFDEYSFGYRSTQTIYENEIFLSVNESEFNVSTNPTALTEFEFESGTIITSASLDPRNNYTQSFFNIKKGTINPIFWEYENSSSLDPTGSYLAPYITTIALYDDALNMVAVAKLPEPIKSLPDYPVNFIVRFDT